MRTAQTEAAASTDGPVLDAPAHPVDRGERPSVGERLKDAVLITLSVIGIMSVAWLLAAWAWGLTIIVFVTGSMAPTMPTGTAAVVQEVEATQLQIGDVVTVPKPDSAIPVTHRIVEIAEVPGQSSTRELSLKGDANDTVDPITYTVTDAQRVLVAVPNAGWLVVLSKNPLSGIALTLAVAGAIAWALWPTKPRPQT
ncbi:signal peptidase I [Microbacterium sp. NPDC091313]